MTTYQNERYAELRELGYECDYIDADGNLVLSLYERTQETLWRVARVTIYAEKEET